MKKVNNAIIMAAGKSSRFIPLSFEKPKSLWPVFGEIMIERQIRQLHEVGINDITLVVGYQADQFMYLEDKFGVNIVMNDDYKIYNNTSTLIRVLDKLSNTYVCSSDNYFVKNPFKKQMEVSTYPVVHMPNEAGEYYVTTNDKQEITDVKIGVGEFAMIGQVFFDEDFSKAFSQLLKNKYNDIEVRENLWEKLYLDHLEDLPKMKAEVVSKDLMLEFDTYEELREFDHSYLELNKSQSLDNICQVLNCEIRDIFNIHPLEGGLTNNTFVFSVKGEKTDFVYRHPGEGTEIYINRKGEALAHRQVKEFDDSLIFIHESGWKILKYIPNYRYFDYNNEEDVNLAINIMKKLHEKKLKNGNKFDVWGHIETFLQEVETDANTIYSDFNDLLTRVKLIKEELDEKPIETVLCHNDIYSTNLLIQKDKYYLIDWEFASETVPAADLATFFVCSPYEIEQIEDITKQYLGNHSEQNLTDYFGYYTIFGMYWLLWAIYQESIGQDVGEFRDKYYTYTYAFANYYFEHSL